MAIASLLDEQLAGPKAQLYIDLTACITSLRCHYYMASRPTGKACTMMACSEQYMHLLYVLTTSYIHVFN